jgi:hypothetical protein
MLGRPLQPVQPDAGHTRVPCAGDPDVVPGPPRLSPSATWGTCGHVTLQYRGYRFAVKPTQKGTHVYRVRIPAQTLYAKGVSPKRSLTVR